jgi:hypothetical protein
LIYLPLRRKIIIGLAETCCNMSKAKRNPKGVQHEKQFYINVLFCLLNIYFRVKFKTMKKFIFVFVPFIANATPGVAANSELLYFELIILAAIGFWLGGEHLIKWVIAKIKHKLHHNKSFKE